MKSLHAAGRDDAIHAEIGDHVSVVFEGMGGANIQAPQFGARLSEKWNGAARSSGLSLAQVSCRGVTSVSSAATRSAFRVSVCSK